MGAAVPLVTAGLGLAGSLFGGINQNQMAAEQAEKQRAFESAEAQKARNFEEQMSDTSYQRAVKDMRMAGINPMLAADRGGASTPSASAPSGAVADVHDVVSPAISSALQGVRVVQDVRNMSAQIENIKAQADKARQEALTEQSQQASLELKRQMDAAVLQGLGYKVPQGGKFSFGVPELLDPSDPQSLQYKQRLQDYLSSQRDYAMQGLELPGLQNAARVAGGKFGLGVEYFNTIAKALGNVPGLGGFLGQLGRPGTQVFSPRSSSTTTIFRR